MGLGKKVVTSPARREVAKALRAKFSLSERRSAAFAQAHRSTLRYRSVRQTDPRVRQRLLELAALRPRYGCDLLWLQLRREGFPVNRKRVLRLYRLERLSLRKKPRKKLVAAVQRIREETLTAPNQRWSMDFMHELPQRRGHYEDCVSHPALLGAKL
jgi:putative transposase